MLYHSPPYIGLDGGKYFVVFYAATERNPTRPIPFAQINDLTEEEAENLAETLDEIFEKHGDKFTFSV